MSTNIVIRYIIIATGSIIIEIRYSNTAIRYRYMDAICTTLIRSAFVCPIRSSFWLLHTVCTYVRIKERLIRNHLSPVILCNKHQIMVEVQRKKWAQLIHHGKLMHAQEQMEQQLTLLLYARSSSSILLCTRL